MFRTSRSGLLAQTGQPRSRRDRSPASAASPGAPRSPPLPCRPSFLLAGLLLAATLTATALLCSCSAPPQPPTPEGISSHAVDPPVATVNGVPITAAELEAEIARRGPARVAGPEAVTALLDELVGARVVAEAARAAGYDRDPAVLAAFRRTLAARYREDLLEPRLAAVAVSDAQVADYYTGHPDAFRTPERVRGAVIHVAVPSRASAEKRAELRERAERARGEALQLGPGSRTFAGVAVRYSDDQVTRYRGGDTGWLEPAKGPGRWPQPVLDALAGLREPGQVGPLVAGEGGFYLVKLVEREASSLRPLDEVQERIRRQLLSEERRRLESEFQAACRARVTVQVDPARLADVAAGREYAAAQPAGPPPVPAR